MTCTIYCWSILNICVFPYMNSTFDTRSAQRQTSAIAATSSKLFTTYLLTDARTRVSARCTMWRRPHTFWNDNTAWRTLLIFCCFFALFSRIFWLTCVLFRFLVNPDCWITVRTISLLFGRPWSWFLMQVRTQDKATTRSPSIVCGCSGRLEQSPNGHSFGTYIINLQKHAQDT